MEFKDRVPDYGVEYLGLHSLNEVHWNLSTPALYEFAIRRYEGQLAHHGPLVVSMGSIPGVRPRINTLLTNQKPAMISGGARSMSATRKIDLMACSSECWHICAVKPYIFRTVMPGPTLSPAIQCVS